MMIKIRKLSYTVDGKKILKNLKMDFNKGKFYTIIGPNGSGKSSVIKAIANQIDYKGSIKVFGQNRKTIKASEFAKRVALMMQFNHPINHITVKEMVSYGRYPYKSVFSKMNESDEVIVEKAIRLCSLEKIKNQELSTLSGGEKQRVFLATCLAQEPEVLILDEPTNHLDVKYQYELLNVVKKLNKETGLTVICVLHDLNQAIKYGDFMYVMSEGSIVDEGAPQDIVNRKIIKEVFEIDTIIHKDKNGMHVDYII